MTFDQCDDHAWLLVWTTQHIVNFFRNVVLGLGPVDRLPDIVNSSLCILVYLSVALIVIKATSGRDDWYSRRPQPYHRVIQETDERTMRRGPDDTYLSCGKWVVQVSDEKLYVNGKYIRPVPDNELGDIEMTDDTILLDGVDVATMWINSTTQTQDELGRRGARRAGRSRSRSR